eukprot:10995238-Prorocentrum_lima.AAC.1
MNTQINKGQRPANKAFNKKARARANKAVAGNGKSKGTTKRQWLQGEDKQRPKPCTNEKIST